MVARLAHFVPLERTIGCEFCQPALLVTHRLITVWLLPDMAPRPAATAALARTTTSRPRHTAIAALNVGERLNGFLPFIVP